MPTIKMTVRTLNALKPPKSGRLEYFDADAAYPGLGLRVTENDQRTWALLYWFRGRKRRLTIGRYPDVSLASARQKARKALTKIADGADPADDKTAERSAHTFKRLAEQYIEKHAKIKKRSWQFDQGVLDRDLLRRFGNRRADSITRREAIEFFEEIRDRGAPILANRTLEVMRRIYNWGIVREIVTINPCARIEKPGVEVSRERVLTDDEIRAVWSALDKEGPLMATAFKLRFLTAARGGEVHRMRRADVDGNWWTIPGEFSKNKTAHRVYLTKTAKALLDAVKPLADTSWIFPDQRTGDFLKLHPRTINRIRRNAKVTFVPHDIRRTVASRLTGDLGVSRLVVSKLLNHAERGTTKVYDRHSYDAEKRRALEAWADRLEEILSGRKREGAEIVPLRSA